MTMVDTSLERESDRELVIEILSHCSALLIHLLGKGGCLGHFN